MTSDANHCLLLPHVRLTHGCIDLLPSLQTLAMYSLSGFMVLDRAV
jgi:hypothetical protein